MGETRDGREFGTNELPSKDAHIVAIEAELAALRARIEKVEWVRDDAIATIKLLQQQLKIQNDSFADRLSEATRLAVKPLEWIGNKASSPVGQYKVKKMGDEWLAFKDGWTIHDSVPAVFASEEAAKAAAQADFERRILPALAHPPAQAVSVTEAMVEAVVKAVRPYTMRTLFIDEHRDLVREALATAALGAQTPPVNQGADRG